MKDQYIRLSKDLGGWPAGEAGEFEQPLTVALSPLSPTLEGTTRDRSQSRCGYEPDSTQALTFRVSGRLVSDVAVQRHSLISDLHGTVVSGDYR